MGERLTEMEHDSKGIDTMAQEGTRQAVRGLSENGPGLSDLVEASASFLGHRGASVEPFGDLRGPDGGSTGRLVRPVSRIDDSACLVGHDGEHLVAGIVSKVSESVGHHALDDGSACHLDNPGAPGGPRAAFVVKAVGDFLRRRGRR